MVDDDICPLCSGLGVVLDLRDGDERPCPECRFRLRYADCPKREEVS